MKVLLHVCCAPCSTVAIERLFEAGHTVTLHFCNPNIFPGSERVRRLKEVIEYGAKLGLCVVEGELDSERWRKAVALLAPRGERSQRCQVCHAMRLDVTAADAVTGGFEGYTTSLTTAPMKRSSTILRTGRMLGRKHGVTFLAEDFKKKNGFQRSSELSRLNGLYRQDYCGCEWSMEEAEARRHRRTETGK